MWNPSSDLCSTPRPLQPSLVPRPHGGEAEGPGLELGVVTRRVTISLITRLRRGLGTLPITHAHNQSNPANPHMAQSQFVSDSLALLSLEREAEVTESEAILAERLQNTRELEEKGACLQRLQVYMASLEHVIL